MKTLIILLLLASHACAQGVVSGAIEYQHKPIETRDEFTNIKDVKPQQILAARLSVAYKINNVDVTATTRLSLSNINDISVLLNFNLPLP